ncbi:MAG TPA: PAS domain-containing sensor histidine kinase [Methanosarcinales archaeon]|nr:PAS domain-containing sensor histidine kinase [Methanosarcinales archaeon]
MNDTVKRERQSVQIREERDNQNLIFESMVDGVYMVSKDHKLEFMNRVLREKFGDRVGGICYETFHGRQVPCPLCKLSKVLDGKTVQWEWHSRRTDEIYDLVETPLTNADGTTSKLTIFRDITERKRWEAEKVQEEQLRLQLLDELERSNNELMDFAYIVSHDLKAPLRAITSLAEWLAADYGDKLDEDGREQLELLKNRTRRMHNLIESILTYSRIGRSNEEKEDVDLNTLVSEVIALIDPPEDITIEVVGELPTIPFERTRMEQIFQNLIRNAALYMDKPEGLIMISCSEDDDNGDSNWRFSVADNGPGIDEKYYKKIFQIFQTLRPRDEIESTGVGLTIVRKIVRMHGGEITVESKLGDGSTFHFTIPKKGHRGGGVS